MKTKKITALLCALAVAVSASVSASAAANTDWPQFLGADHTGITAAQTPAAAAETELNWSSSSIFTDSYGFPSSGYGTPILAGGFLYVTDKAAGKLLKLNAKTGAVAAQAAVGSLPAFFCSIAYGDRKIYVPQETAGGVKISAFSADTLALVWQSGEFAAPGGVARISSPITYNDRHIYFGTYFMNTATYQYTSGNYVCLDTAAGNVAWKNDNTAAGYYWNGGTVLGSAIAVVDSAGTVHTFDLLTGTEKASTSAGGEVNSTPAYSGGTLYVSVKNGTVFSIKAAADGALDDATAKHSAKLGNKIISSPVVCNGRLYVAGGDASTPFSVLNAADLSVIYQISDIHSQSTPLVTTAYAAETNHRQVLIYVTDAGTVDENYEPLVGSSRVFVIKDTAVQTASSYETLYTPKTAQFCSQSLIPSGDGMLYFYNDSGTLFALGKKAVKPAQPASGASSAASAKPSSSSASAAGTVSSSSASSALDSPKTGEASAASAAVLLACSGAVLLFLKKKVKQ